uniref:Uncharacterized protein n=1 Tax=Quercus lobata TaxID=97700 RepID=A0A7N2LWH8_QUELO
MGDFTYENNLVPKFPSQVIRNAEIIEGNGGPRTIKKTIYAEVRNVSYNSKIVTTLDGGYSSSTSSYRSYSSTSTGKRQVNAEGTGRIKAIKNHPHPHAYN